MEIRNNGMRFINYDAWQKTKYDVYDYSKNGLLRHIMSPAIVNTDNAVLKIILQYIESSMIFVMKYTDMLKNFKNTHWRNR